VFGKEAVTRRRIGLPGARRGVRFIVLPTFMILVTTTLVSCKAAGAPEPVPADSGRVTESFQLRAENSTVASVVSSASSNTASGGWKPAPPKDPLVTVTPANPTAKPDPTPAPGTTWPAKVGGFAKTFKKPVWYPTYAPKSYVLDSVDVVELDPGTGLVCSVVFTDGQKAVQLTQGSPTNRTYPIISLGKVAWGSAKADIMHQDPADSTSPLMIVYTQGGNFAEVSGDAPTEELKAVAASMKLVTY
jgi:hypothetical protein